MAIYRLTPPRVEATQWVKNGDHPEVGLWLDPDHEGRTKGLLPDGTFVDPGDWILEDLDTGVLTRIKNDLFARTYEIE